MAGAFTVPADETAEPMPAYERRAHPQQGVTRMKPLHQLSLTEASAGIARRRFSPTEYLDALQARAQDVRRQGRCHCAPVIGMMVLARRR
jgi:hypothetical protein